MRFLFIAALLCIPSIPVLGDILTRHTNIKCETKDKSYLEVKNCRLKVMGRGIIGANIHLKMLQLPIKSVAINFGVWKKLSEYHPFLFNITLDYCHYLKHPNPLSVFHYFFKTIKPYTNMNYTCPITTDFILKDFALEEKMFAKFPVPTGSYMFSIHLFGEGALKSSIYTYMQLSVDNDRTLHNDH